ncbi:hypothetical protein [Mesorhizobium sp. B1-1-8]|uniref:hypothetical protein n=1 Tax=Mesorhizobium sp. B1-1-8 TaxID=2589976 RepID=UPI00112866C8|nr:hypothetical protein [Mesorhizobium sp. B1-1-8]UCI10738.1 hypothetical protein FJ974_28710 [Mesorhizobium sp. B1-1-8]
MLLEQGLDNGNLIVALAALDGIEAAEREIESPGQGTTEGSAATRHRRRQCQSSRFRRLIFRGSVRYYVDY